MRKLRGIMTPLRLLVVCACLFFIISCTETKNEADRVSLLPPAVGGGNEIILVMDTNEWNGEVGDILRRTLSNPYPVLPQKEVSFLVRSVTPSAFLGLLKKHTNVLVVADFSNTSPQSEKLRSFFSDESIKKVEQTPSLYKFIYPNVYAKDQEIFYFFAKDRTTLIKNLNNHKREILEHFNAKERKEIREKLDVRRNRAYEGLLSKKKSMNMIVPKGFEEAANTSNFLWLRHPEIDFDKNIIVATRSYVSREQFEPQNIIKWKDEIAKEWLYGDPADRQTYVETETLIPPLQDTVDFKGRFAIETRGLWKTHNKSMGGPFISYVFYDEKQQKLFYIEGFVFAPGKKKRPYMRELETILWSF